METFNTLYREIQTQLSKRMAKIEFGIIKNHRDALESIQSELTVPHKSRSEDGRFNQAETNPTSSLQTFPDSIRKPIEKLLRRNNAYIRSRIIEMFKDSFYRHAWAIDQDAGFAFSWGPVPTDSVEDILDSSLSKSAGSESPGTVPHEALNRICSEITLCLVPGESHEKISRCIGRVLGFSTNNRFIGRGQAYQSLRIARTEGQRALVRGQKRAYERARENGIEVQELWDAALGGCAQESHKHLDGRKKGEDGMFDTPVGKISGPMESGVNSFDIHCRCRIRGWIPGYSPHTRYVRGKGEIPWVSHDEWKRGLDENGIFAGEILYTSPEGGGSVLRTYSKATKEQVDNLIAAKILADRKGYRVELLGVSNIEGAKSADVLINGEEWEIKTNKTNSYNAVDRAVRTAGSQASNLILRLVSNIDEDVWKNAVGYRYSRSEKIRKVIVITSEKKILTPSDREIRSWIQKRLL